MKGFINKRFERWLSKRVPSNFEHKLSSRNIFIMPTRFGFVYLFFDALLFLLGTNYQNNTILLLSYLLASLFITVMMHSFYNFSQLTFSSTAKQFTFAKQQAFFPISIKANKSHFDLNFRFVTKTAPSQKAMSATPLSTTSQTIRIEQCEVGECQVLLPYLPIKRGIVDLGRVKVFSEYSLGLFITWAMLDFSHQLVVFPESKTLSNNHNYLSGLDDAKQNQNNHQQASTGIDDFTELKNYIVGESQARIAWKQLARGQGKLSKHYQDEQGSLRWLKLSDMPSLAIETKLSYLCFLILEYGKSEGDFGLLLDADSSGITSNKPAMKIMPSSGYQHQQNCLIALAEFEPVINPVKVVNL
tara:strand:- start:2267 stop:3340 length:1074 start_codon:yes stop_codon:yes gene_type:complete